MAVIKYCDFTNGDDDTGDGTVGTPYKTITKASIGLTGGDEVRVAKSTDSTALTGTLGFTISSTAVVGTSTLFTSELAIGDFVQGGDGQWYEVVTITDDTHATLFKVYPSATEAGVSSQKLGVTSTGAAAASSTQVQVVSASGSSAGSRLKISGGWDLTGPTQDGQTYFRQMHGTFNTRYGRGLYASSKHYIEMERLHFLRYDNCIYMIGCDWWKITSPNLLSAGDETFYLSSCENNEIITPVVNGSNDTGIYLYANSYNNTIIDPICNSNNYTGIYISSNQNNTIINPTCNNNHNGSGIRIASSFNNTIINPTCNNNSNSHGIILYSSFNNTIINPTCNNNYYYGIYSDNSSNNIANKFSGTGNGTDIGVLAGKNYSDYPCFKCQHFQTEGANKCFYEYGITERDTADARSTQCLKYDSTSATYYISQSFFFKADSGVAQTLSAYIKKEVAFNGDVQMAIFFMGEEITAWSDETPTDDDTYEQKSLVAGAGDITEDGVLELRIKVRGTAGNIFVDDLATA